VRLDPSSSVQIHGSPLNSRQIAVTVYLLNYYTSSSSVSRSGSTDLRVSDPISTSRYVTSGNPQPKTIAQKYSTSAEKKSFHPLTRSCVPAWFLSLDSTPPHPRVAISLPPSLPALPKPLVFLLRRRGAPIRSPEGASPRFASCPRCGVAGEPLLCAAPRCGGRAWRHGDGAAGLMRS
jgi:hypothetical protein